MLVDRLLSFEVWFAQLGRRTAILLGCATGAVFIVIGWLTSWSTAIVLGFLVYFPFHCWLVAAPFVVPLSTAGRERIFAGGANWGGGFFTRPFTAFGLFCMAWYFTLIGAGVISGVMT